MNYHQKKISLVPLLIGGISLSMLSLSQLHAKKIIPVRKEIVKTEKEEANHDNTHNIKDATMVSNFTIPISSINNTNITTINSTETLSLAKAWNLSQKFDAPFLASKKEYEANLEKEKQARGLLLPKVTFSASGTQQNQENLYGGGRDDLNNNISSRNIEYGLDLRQPLFNIGLWKQFQQGKLTTTTAEINYKKAKQDAIIRLATSYISLVQSQRDYETLMAQKKNVEKQLHFAKKSFEVGTTTITDTLEAQSRYDQIISQELSLQQSILVKKRTLQDLLGSWNDYDNRPSLDSYHFQFNSTIDTQHVDEPANDLLYWLEVAKTNNSSILLSQLSVKNAQLALDKEKANHYPTIDLVASTSKSRVPLAFLGGATVDNTDKSLSLQLSIPIFNGGSTMSKVSESEALLKKALLDEENTYKSILHQLEDYVYTINSNIAKYNAYKTALKSTTASLKATKTAFDLGLRTQMDVLNAQSQVSDIETKLSNTQSETFLLWLKLQAAAGVLDDESLK
jgi:outer membrane protein